MSSAESRFWKRVDKNGPPPSHLPWLGACWLWGGTKLQTGYGRIWVGQRMELAHRYAYAVAHRCTVHPQTVIMHRCDNPQCVRPSHLKAGTQADNVRDQIAKGRKPHADQAAKKLTSTQVLQLREARQQGATYRALAAQFGITVAMTHKICSGKSWASVGGPRAARIHRTPEGK